MTVPTCEYTGCETPLTTYQLRFCCLDHRRCPPQACLTCSTVYAPIRRRQRYCSVACTPHLVRHRAPPVLLLRLLDLLRATGSWWLTTSDLSIWMYGSDTASAQAATRTLLYRLRQTHDIEDRLAPWDRPFCGPCRAYRLAQTPVEREAAA